MHGGLTTPLSPYNELAEELRDSRMFPLDAWRDMDMDRDNGAVADCEDATCDGDNASGFLEMDARTSRR